MVLEQTNAAIATLNDLAPQIVSGYGAANAAATQAESDLAGADATVASQLQKIIGLLQPLVAAQPAAATDPAAGTIAQ